MWQVKNISRNNWIQIKYGNGKSLKTLDYVTVSCLYIVDAKHFYEIKNVFMIFPHF